MIYVLSPISSSSYYVMLLINYNYFIFLNVDLIILFIFAVQTLILFVMIQNFDFSKYVAGVVYLTEDPSTNYVMCVYSNLEAASKSYEVVELGYKVRSIHLLTSDI